MAKLLARGFSIRLAAGAVLFFGCALAARPADVVILKDGFTIQGNVRKETSTINDPFAKSMTILKADGFDFIDDGVRLTILSQSLGGTTTLIVRRHFSLKSGRSLVPPIKGRGCELRRAENAFE